MLSCRTDFAGMIGAWLALEPATTSNLRVRTARMTGQKADLLIQQAVQHVRQMMNGRWGQGTHKTDTVTAPPWAQGMANNTLQGLCMGGLSVDGSVHGDHQWVVAVVVNTATGPDAESVSVRYLGVLISLGLDWSKNTSKLKSKVGCVLSRLRYAGAPYAAVCEVMQTMIASRAAFSAQVAHVPEELLQHWEEEITAMILRDLGLTTASSKGDRRHFFFGDTRLGGLGYTGLVDSIRADQVMGYVTRRAAVGTVHARIAQYQDAALARLVTADSSTDWKGSTTADGGEEPIWAMQRVHRALPADGELAYAPSPWVVERQGEPRERGVGIHAYPSGLEQLTEPNRVVHKMQEDVRQSWAQQLAKQRQSDAVAVAQARNTQGCREGMEKERLLSTNCWRQRPGE